MKQEWDVHTSVAATYPRLLILVSNKNIVIGRVSICRIFALFIKIYENIKNGFKNEGIPLTMTGAYAKFYNNATIEVISISKCHMLRLIWRIGTQAVIKRHSYFIVLSW